jgi:hypothetical protein
MLKPRHSTSLIIFSFVLQITLFGTSQAIAQSQSLTFVSNVPGKPSLTMEVDYPISLYCDWFDPKDDEYGYCASSLTDKTSKSTSTSGPKPAPSPNVLTGNPFASGITYRFINPNVENSTSLFWRVVYFFNGRSLSSEWKYVNDFSTNPTDFIRGTNEAFRFYGPGEMQLEFRGYENRDCYVANCPGFLNGYTLQSTIFPKIKLVGLTKVEATREEEREEEASYQRSKAADEEWEFGKFNDGIDSFIYVDQDSDYSYGQGGDSTLRIYCQNKKLGAWISVNYADSRGWQGNAQVRFDSKPVKKLPYTLGRRFDLISINSPKSFVSDFLKSKKVLVKIWTVKGSEVPLFYLGNLSTYKKQFASKGCKLG